jgi:hypothetical protein
MASASANNWLRDNMSFLNGLLILLYLVLGTLGIALLGSWALKRFKSRK